MGLCNYNKERISKAFSKTIFSKMSSQLGLSVPFLLNAVHSMNYIRNLARTEFRISIDVDWGLDATIDALCVPNSALTRSRACSYYVGLLTADVMGTANRRTSVSSLGK